MESERPIYAIGDVHGRSDLLKSIVAFCETDAARRGGAPRFRFLGDIVDRGHDSKGCLDIVGRVLLDHPGSLLHIGNHDDWFLRYIEENDPIETHNWFHQGGMETIASYGNLGLDDARRLIMDRHRPHLDLLKRASMLSEDGGFVFVHAGINPEKPIERQTRRECTWIRFPFLEFVGRFSQPIVHGHTIMRRGIPLVTENRISMDTGAYASGRLSVLVIDPRERMLAFHQTDGNAKDVVAVDPERIDRGRGTVLDDVPSLFETRDEIWSLLK